VENQGVRKKDAAATMKKKKNHGNVNEDRAGGDEQAHMAGIETDQTSVKL